MDRGIMRGKQQPVLSIIVPVYNVEKYIRDCLDSILAQSFQEFEVILIDDGSSDQSGAICDLYAEKDERIHVVHKENGGLSSARNTGLDLAKGLYVGFVDSDDWISATMYEHLLQAVRTEDADIAACRWVEEEHIQKFKSVHTYTWNSKEVLRHFFLRQITESVCDKVFAVEMWRNVRFPEGEINEDTITLFSLLLKCRRAVFVDTEEYYYRAREGSITKSGYSRKFRIVESHLRKMREKVLDRLPSLKKYVDYFLSVHYYCLLLSVLKSGEFHTFRDDYRYYRKRFAEVFPAFMWRGTGKEKDRVIGLALRYSPVCLIRPLLRR